MGWTELSSTNIQENILFFDRMNLESQNVDQKTKLTLHPEMGEGYVRRFLPRYDMEVVVSDYTFYRSQCISLSTKSPMVELNFCLKGERGISVQGKEHQLLPGLCSLQFMSEVEARFEYVGNEPFYMLGIGIPVSTFHHFMEESNGQLSLESLAQLNPDHLFVINNWQAPIQGGVKETLKGSNVWNSLNAVKNNQVYELADPSLPGPMALAKIDGIEEIMKAMGKHK